VPIVAAVATEEPDIAEKSAQQPIFVWRNPNRRETIRQDILHHGADYTPWEGFEVTGWPVMTMVRGKVVAEEGRVIRRKGFGRAAERSAP
jgi:dihydropyrimidinase